MVYVITTEELEQEIRYKGQIIGEKRTFDYQIYCSAGEHSIHIIEQELCYHMDGEEYPADLPTGPSVTVFEKGSGIPIDNETRFELLSDWLMALADLTTRGVKKGRYGSQDDSLVERLSR